ncbi:putative bifunctional diguanylate cyclase/phosphodiesterase [Planosporangium sp. 12N6]|uniref:putative bifunctional diguanylate cyclase/phosphodiesterase n=1 Tax=Planosporangium spinosum TaxID=3402278 RepID=UPI003CF3015A
MGTGLEATDVRRVNGATVVLPAVVALAALATVWFALSQRGSPGPAVLGWVPAPAALTLAAMALRRTATTTGPPAAHRFYTRLTVACAACAAGSFIQAGYAVLGDDPEATRVPPEAAVCFVGALLYMLWALLRLPLARRTRTESVRLSLDCATVMLGGAVLLWYVGAGPSLAAGGVRATWALLAVGGVCLAGVASVCKLALADGGPVDPGALRLLAFGLLIGGVSAGAAMLLGHHAHLIPGQVSVPYIAVFLVLAAERQQRVPGLAAERQQRVPGLAAERQQRVPGAEQYRWTAAEEPLGNPRPGRLSDPLPGAAYLAVAATEALLLLVTVGGTDERRYVVVGGSIVITALVVVRQVVALRDNARLAGRLRQQEDRLRRQASHDPLTRLANRTDFGDRLDAALAAGAVTVLLIDLDDFKTVNDTLGHGVGDRLLALVAERVRGCVRSGDTVARLGGDEFAVLLRQAWPATVDAVADAILTGLRQPVVVDGHELLVQASIGVAEAVPGDDPEALLRKADIAMYAAKESGKDGFARYVPGMGADIVEHAQLGAQLRQALDGGQLRLLYQPVVRIADGRIIGMEALARWHHPGRGEVPPGEFIPIAERTGLIVPLGRWVLREACRQKAAWRAAYGDLSPATVGVNVSGRQLQEPGFADEVADAVHEAGLQPHNLVLEVTETAVLTGGQALETLRALRAFGVSLALDDFGTGQSSLGLIRTCPVHILKLDKSFVIGGPDGDAEARAQQQAVAAAVVHMADALGLDAVAEGIENAEQAERLAALGYRLGQGYHLVRPLPADEITRLLALDRVAN